MLKLFMNFMDNLNKLKLSYLQMITGRCTDHDVFHDI